LIFIKWTGSCAEKNVGTHALENAMGTATSTPSFDALDACHQQIQAHLAKLTALAKHVAESGIDPTVRAQALEIESFFSSTSREHHAEEEANVFPALLSSGDATLAAAVRTLQQDHGWIEENWLELAPRLRAIASGNGWIDETEFLNFVEVFLELCNGHIALEETLIYPESKARWAQAVAARVKRLDSARMS
jgi:hemerythrin-like domain-containing protein